MNYNNLTPQEERVIIHKATEPPFKGKYENFYEDGTFICRYGRGVTLRYFHQKANLMLDVDGQVLMKVTQMQ